MKFEGFINGCPVWSDPKLPEDAIYGIDWGKTGGNLTVTRLDLKDTPCKHKWELVKTESQFPTGYSGTSAAIEYAYLLCQKCSEVRKKEVKS